MAPKNTKQTSSEVAKKASELLRNPKSPAKVKTVSASTLAQTKPNKKK